MPEAQRQVPRIVMSLWGMPKSGKTHFALTLPGKIVAIEIGETGIEDLAWKFRKDGKEIIHRPLISPSLSVTLADHKKILVDFEATLRAAIADTTVKTIIIDSMSRLWRSIRVVKTEESFADSVRTKRNQADYELANDYHEQIVQLVRMRPDLNLVLVHRHREIFAKNGESLQATGEVESRDYRGLENIVQIVMRTDIKDKKFYQTMEYCRFDARLNGRVFEGYDYDKLVKFLFEDEEE